MALQLSVAARNAREAQLWTTINAAGSAVKLLLYTGPAPANCAAADTGTLLGTLSLPSPEENAPSGGAATIASTWTGSISYAGGGLIGHLRIQDAAGTVHLQLAVSYNAVAWVASTAYVAGQKVSANGNVYNCTAAGTSAASGSGPSGTTASITDGGVTWAYVQPVGDMLVDNPQVAANQNFSVTSFTLTEANA